MMDYQPPLPARIIVYVLTGVGYAVYAVLVLAVTVFISLMRVKW